MSRFVSALLLASFAPIALGLTGCGTTENAASQVVKTPELALSDQETKCKVRKSQAEPLIVEWPNASRGRLESVTKRSLVAIKYSGCELEQLPGCTIKSSVGNYAYWPITRKQSRVTMHNADELYANMPVGAVSLEGKLKTAGQLEVQMTIVGRYEAPTHTVYQDDLQGNCEGATHVIAALTTGSFTFSAGGDAEVGGSAQLGPAGAGGKSTAKRETLQSDGDEAACARATGTDKGPPEGCGALLQIEVTSLQPGNRPPPAPVVVAPPVAAPVPVTPPVEPPVAENKPPLTPKKPPKCKKGERVEDGACVKIGKKPATKPGGLAGVGSGGVVVGTLGGSCASGQHREGSRCVNDAPPPSSETPPPPRITQCAEGMRLDGDRCVPEPEPEPSPVPSSPRKSTPTVYDAPARPTEEPNPWRPVLGYAGIGFSLTALTAGIVALTAVKAVKDGCMNDVCSQEADDKKSTAMVAAVIADVSLGLAIVSYLGVLFLPNTTKVGVSASRHGASVGARWSW